MAYYAIVMQTKTARAVLVLDQKVTHSSGRIEELKAWKVPVTDKYPDGIRYRLVYVDPRSKQVLVLFDNHYPKGHHVHIGDREKGYEYTGTRKLLKDFRQTVDQLKKKESK